VSWETKSWTVILQREGQPDYAVTTPHFGRYFVTTTWKGWDYYDPMEIYGRVIVAKFHHSEAK
jgi:hypothetical protein